MEKPTPAIHPKVMGDTTTLAAMLALHQAGYSLLVPFGENCRYDLAIDGGDGLLRVQCKTGRLRSGAVRFATCSTYGHHASAPQVRRDYTGQIDCFAVYCPDTSAVYLVPIADLQTRTQGCLRIEPPRNGQRLGIRWAADYLVASIRSESDRSAPFRCASVQDSG